MEDNKTTQWELNLAREDFKDSCILLRKFSKLPTWAINVIRDICSAIIDLRLDGME